MSYEQDFWKSVRKLQTCKNCRFWMTTLSPEDRAEAARYENTDGVCDMFNEDGFSPNDYCSRWSARPEDVKRAMEATSSMHEYIEEEARKSREQYAQLTEREPSFSKEEEKTDVCPYNGFEKCRREQCPFWGITQLIFDPSKIPGEQRIDIYGCKRVKKELERNNGET